MNQTARPGDGRAITVQRQQVVDPSVRQAAMRSQLLMQVTPGCPAGLAMVQLAGKIEETVIPKNS